MATTHSPSKPPKTGSTRRKISLPWFRQASIGEKLTRLRLPRQNTVDCHASSHAPSGPSSAPCTAPCPASGPGDKLTNAFRRKVLSGSASVEVKHDGMLTLEKVLKLYTRQISERLISKNNPLTIKYLRAIITFSRFYICFTTEMHLAAPHNKWRHII